MASTEFLVYGRFDIFLENKNENPIRDCQYSENCVGCELGEPHILVTLFFLI